MEAAAVEHFQPILGAYAPEDAIVDYAYTVA